jgi:hypothetical protein
LVDVPLRSAGTFFILAPVRCSAEKEELTSSFIIRNACHGNNTRHVPHWPGPSRRSLYSCPLSFGDGHEAAIPCPYRGFRSENLKRAVDAPSPPDQSPHATNHVLHAPAWIPSGFTAALGRNKEEEEEIRVPPLVSLE